MCFRPPDVSETKQCPKCGGENDSFATTCAHCGEMLSTFAMPAIPKPAAPGGPGAPSAPKAPGAPKPPAQ